MSYTIAPSTDGPFIVLTVEGEINRQHALQQNQEAHALGRELGLNRYLVDVTRARNTDSACGNYEFAYSDMQSTPDLDPTARVATLVSPGDHSHDFVETVAQNAGLNVRLFTDRQAAVDYLTRD